MTRKFQRGVERLGATSRFCARKGYATVLHMGSQVVSAVVHLITAIVGAGELLSTLLKMLGEVVLVLERSGAAFV